jgi:hypothetical protein
VNDNAYDNAEMPRIRLMIVLMVMPRPLLVVILMIMIPMQRIRQMREGDM